MLSVFQSDCSFSAFISEVDTEHICRVLSIPSDPFHELHMLGQNDTESGQKTFAFTKKSESLRGIFYTKTKTSKSPVAFSLTCTHP